jgi:uncharacterized membrane protein YcaP (DUF421 family)
MDINQLQILMQIKDVFSLTEVAYALLETDGTMSVLRKSEYEKPMISEMRIQQKPVYVTGIYIGKLWKNKDLMKCGC